MTPPDTDPDTDTDTNDGGQAATHRWTHDTPRIRGATGERIERGDEFIPTDHELRCWPDRIRELPTCAGKGGECSRRVDEWGDRCWQHELEDGEHAED